jgi:hypothetical protein
VKRAVGLRCLRCVLDLHAGGRAVFLRLTHDRIDTRGHCFRRFGDLLRAARFFFGAHGFFLLRWLTYKHGRVGRVGVDGWHAHGRVANPVAGQVAVEITLVEIAGVVGRQRCPERCLRVWIFLQCTGIESRQDAGTSGEVLTVIEHIFDGETESRQVAAVHLHVAHIDGEPASHGGVGDGYGVLLGFDLDGPLEHDFAPFRLGLAILASNHNRLPFLVALYHPLDVHVEGQRIAPALNVNDSFHGGGGHVWRARHHHVEADHCLVTPFVTAATSPLITSGCAIPRTLASATGPK